MADHPNTTAKLEVYLTHLKWDRCEYGIEHLPCFMYLDFWCQMKKEWILWTKVMKAHLQDLEALTELAYKDFAAYLCTEAGTKS